MVSPAGLLYFELCSGGAWWIIDRCVSEGLVCRDHQTVMDAAERSFRACLDCALWVDCMVRLAVLEVPDLEYTYPDTPTLYSAIGLQCALVSRLFRCAAIPSGSRRYRGTSRVNHCAYCCGPACGCRRCMDFGSISLVGALRLYPQYRDICSQSLNRFV